MMPIVDELEMEMGEDVEFMRLDALKAENAALQSQHNLYGHPAFAIVDRSGRIVQSFFGPQPIDVLRDGLSAVLSE